MRVGVTLRGLAAILLCATLSSASLRRGSTPETAAATPQSTWSPYYVNTLNDSQWRSLRAEVAELARAGFGPVLVRLAWHDAATANIHTGTGGPHGTILVQHPADPDNVGLDRAIRALQPVYNKYKDDISNADLWSFAACVAITVMGGPATPWRSGRQDYTDISQAKITEESNALPDARFTPAQLQTQFERYGMNVTDIAALILGGHGIGRCHREYSGYHGPWTGAENTFSIFYSTTSPASNAYVRENLTLPDGSASYQLNAKSLLNGKMVMQLPSDVSSVELVLKDPQALRMFKDKKFFFGYWVDVFQRLLEVNLDVGRLGAYVSTDHTD